VPLVKGRLERDEWLPEGSTSFSKELSIQRIQSAAILCF
jgi:hypothetical protein